MKANTAATPPPPPPPSDLTCSQQNMNTVVDPECFELDPDLIVEKKKKFFRYLFRSVD